MVHFGCCTRPWGQVRCRFAAADAKFESSSQLLIEQTGPDLKETMCAPGVDLCCFLTKRLLTTLSLSINSCHDDVLQSERSIVTSTGENDADDTLSLIPR